MSEVDKQQLELIEKKLQERIKRLKIECKTASGGRKMVINKTIKELEGEMQS